MLFKVREVFRNLPGARGVVLPKYEPVASHGDPLQTQNDLNFLKFYVQDHTYFETLPHFLIFWWVLRGGRPIQNDSY